jgi:hypothetical protein
LKSRILIAFAIGILLIVLGTGAILWYVVRHLPGGALLFGISEQMLANPPIASIPGVTDRIVHGIDPVSLLQDQPTGALNAATSYIEVVRSLAARHAEGSLELSPEGIYILTDSEFDTFLEGARQTDCDFSKESLVLDGKPVRLAPAAAISDSLEHLSWLREIGRAVIERGAQYEAAGRTSEALQLYEATVKFGFDVERGRESIIQVFCGAAIQKMGAQKLKQFYEANGAALRAQQWSDFLDDLEIFQLKFKDKTDMLIKAVDFTPESVANGLWILEHDQDHVFRREALTGLRVKRVLACDTIDPVLERIAESDPDPYVREAAQNALKSMPVPETYE